MTDWPNLALALMAGLLLGAIFFGGLWFTVQRLTTSAHPALWFMGSLLLRMGIVLPGFYFVSGGDWRRMVAALVGFVIARLAVLQLSRPASTNALLAQESDHAP
jgi:F1F0 ATPase subunit 2